MLMKIFEMQKAHQFMHFQFHQFYRVGRAKLSLVSCAEKQEAMERTGSLVVVKAGFCYVALPKTTSLCL